MSALFLNKKLFSILFLALLGIDLCVKLWADPFPWRYLTKPLLVISLIIFYVKNSNEFSKRNFSAVLVALLCFLMGDILLISHEIELLLILGILIFSIGKLLYVYRLSHQEDFKLVTIVPFLLISFCYMFLMFYVIYDNLGTYFIPVLIYIFISQLMFLMAYLRYSVIVLKGFSLVFLGVIFFIASESIMSLKLFYGDVFMQDFFVLLFYGLAQFFIIFGIVESRKRTNLLL